MRLTPGGSSGGAAAALAARMVAVADGTDMMAALPNPAGWGTLWSLRPSWGRVPSDPGPETLLPPLSTIGPMARTPQDLAALLTVMAAPEPRRPFGRTLSVPAGREGDMGGVRVGRLADWGGAYAIGAGVRETCAGALARLEAIGCGIVPRAPPFPAEALWEN